MEAPHYARLDLFTGGGESVLSAALVDGEVRGSSGELGGLPPPALFWGALGVFRPGRSGNLQGAQNRRDGTTEVTFRYPGDTQVRYRLQGRQIEAVELLRGGRVVEEVTLERGEQPPFPVEARYRHLGERRELRITLEETENVESFPPDIWEPSR